MYMDVMFMGFKTSHYSIPNTEKSAESCKINIWNSIAFIYMNTRDLLLIPVILRASNPYPLFLQALFTNIKYVISINQSHLETTTT